MQWPVNINSIPSIGVEKMAIASEDDHDDVRDEQESVQFLVPSLIACLCSLKLVMINGSRYIQILKSKNC
jgi:hypothetical protein